MIWKKFVVFLSLLLPIGLWAQTSTFTATITDSDGTVWANCGWTAQLQTRNGTTPYLNGVALTPSQITVTGTCNSSGVMTGTLSDDMVVTPSGSQWIFTIQPNASVSASVVVTTAVTGATPNLSTVLSAGIQAPRFPAGPNAKGYVNAEVSTLYSGATYFNVTSAQTCIYTTTWTCGGGGGGSVSSVFGRTGAVVATSGDYAAYYATVASVTASGIQSTLQAQTNCNTSNGYYYSPYSGICIAVPGSGGTGSQYSPAYFSATNTIGGITPANGVSYFSSTGAPSLYINDQEEAEQSNTLLGLNEGDSIDCGVGTLNGQVTTSESYLALLGLGVSSGNITNHCLSGSGVNLIAERAINTGTFTPYSYTISDGYENNGTTTNVQYGWSLYHENMALAAHASTLDPSYDSVTGFPAKTYASSPMVLNSANTSGTLTASADFPTAGETCGSATCTLDFPYVPGTDIHIILEVVTHGYGGGANAAVGGGSQSYPIGYNPTIAIDGQTIPGSWSNTTAAWLQVIPEIDGYLWAPYDIHIKVPNDGISGQSFGGSGRHDVQVTVPQYVTVVEVIGNGADRQTSFPKYIQIGQPRWFQTNNNYNAASNNGYSLGSILEVAQGGNPVGFYDPSGDADGYITPSVKFTGCTTNLAPEVTITTNGSGGIASIVPTPGASVNPGTCSSPTLTIGGSGTGATATCTVGGGGCTSYTVTAAGTGYYGNQTFSSNQGHPNSPAQAAIAQGVVAKFRPLTSPRNADAGTGLVNSGQNHQEQALDYGWYAAQPATGTTLTTAGFININPYFAMTSKSVVDNITVTADPGIPGKCTLLHLITGSTSGYTVTFDTNMYVGSSNAYSYTILSGTQNWRWCYVATPANSSKSYRWQGTVDNNNFPVPTPVSYTITSTHTASTLIPTASNPDPVASYAFHVTCTPSANASAATVYYTINYTDQFGVTSSYQSPTITPVTTSTGRVGWNDVTLQVSNTTAVTIQATVTGTGLTASFTANANKVAPQQPYLTY